MKEIFAVVLAAMCVFPGGTVSGLAADAGPPHPNATGATATDGMDGASLRALQDKLRAETVIVNGTIGLDGVHHFYGATPLGQDKDNAVRYWTASSPLTSRPHGGNDTLSDPSTSGDGGDDNEEIVACAGIHSGDGVDGTIAIASLPDAGWREDEETAWHIHEPGVSGALSRTVAAGMDDAASDGSVPIRQDLPNDPNHDIAANLASPGPTAPMTAHAARVGNVIHIGMRASHDAANAAFDRAFRYCSVLAELAVVTGSDAAHAATLLNASALNRIWAGAAGEWDNAAGRKGFPGYRYNAYGVTLGYDRAIRNGVFGASYSFTTGKYVDKAATAHDSHNGRHAVTLYAGYRHHSGLFGTIVANWAFSNNDLGEYRNNEWDRQDFSTTTWQIGGKVGYEYKPAENVSLSPVVGFGYIGARSSAHTGYRSGNAEHHVGRMRSDTAFIPVELHAAYTYRINPEHRFDVRVKGGYTYNFDARGPRGNVYRYDPPGGMAIPVVGRDNSHSGFSVGAGIQYRHSRLDIGASYGYTVMAGDGGHRVALTASAQF
ncbi:MAG: autotransporter outer membrane beta-barrel domain-containing protein [Planctomycetes bacterium]|nr:autotransporter outer membrane beta-barrel domain-containing protein [Planctomycetota bacterium]